MTSYNCHDVQEEQEIQEVQEEHGVQEVTCVMEDSQH